MRMRVVGVLALCSSLIIFNQCKKDDPAPNAGVSFDVEAESTTESDGTVKSFHPLLWQSYANAAGATGTATGREYKVKIVLDRPAADAAVVSFTLSGTAVKNTAAAVGDYSIDNTNVAIDKGATEAYITFTLFEDFEFFELDTDDLFKTLIITLDKVVSGPVSIADTKTVYTLTISEDDLLAVLQWNVNDNGTAATDALDVDMDMLLWSGSTQTPLGSTTAYTASQYSSKVGTEYVSIPGGFPNATYGLSYVYYSGTSNSLDFYAFFVGTVGTTKYTLDQPLIFKPNPKYTQANVNKYDDATTGKTPVIVQTVVKSSLTFSNVSSIAVPSTGSRMQSSVIDVKRMKTSPRYIPKISY